jgi:AraC family L-rhamnose operon transcriptional activator RhaR
MKRFQPLLLQKLDIRIPGLHVRQLGVHRHLPETTTLEPHTHRFAQCLLYLSGQGNQQIADAVHPVRAGTAVFLPPRVRHAFLRQANRRPICLVLDFDWRGAGQKPPRAASLPAITFRLVQQQVAEIARLQRRPPSGPALQTSGLILGLLDLLLGGMGLKELALADAVSPVRRKLERLLDQQDAAALSVGDLARRAGYQHDYLNRLLKNQSGLTVGQVRSLKQLTRAEQLLRGAQTVGDVSSALGFSDANYFARWFRRQTGTTPTEWRKTANSG